MLEISESFIQTMAV